MALNVSTETTSADYINQLESLFSQGRITAKDLQDITTIGRGVFPEVNVWASNKLSEMQPSNPNPRSVRELSVNPDPESKGFNPRMAAVAESQAEERQSRVEEAIEEERQAVAARTTEEGRALTLEEIRKSSFLTENGIVAGDRVKGNEIIRVYSRPEDAQLGGKLITQEDIDNSKFLQDNNVGVGSRVFGDTIIDSGAADSWKQWRYSVDKDEKPLERASNILETYFPFRQFDRLTAGRPHYLAGQDHLVDYADPDELFEVEGYMDMTPDQRRQARLLQRDRALQEKYGHFFVEDETSAAAVSGVIMNQLTDPTAGLAMGRTLVQQGLRGAALFGGMSALEDLSEKGVVDPEKAAKMSAAGLVFVSGIGYVSKTIVNKVAAKKADKIVKKAQAELDIAVADGVAPDNPWQILKDAGLDAQEVAVALEKTGTRLNVHRSATNAAKAVDKALVEDSAVSRQYMEGLDRLAGILSTQVRNIDEGVFGRLRHTEYSMASRTYAKTAQVEPFLKSLQSAPKNIKNQISKALYNGRFDEATKLMKNVSPTMAREFTDTVVPLLKNLGEELRENGRSFELIENYFPRLVKDYRGLRKDLGSEYQGVISEQLRKAEKLKGRTLRPHEKDKVIEGTLRGYRHDGKGKPSFAQQRQVTLTDSNLPYYAEPEEALSMYIRNAINDIEVSKFFKGSTKKTNDGVIDVDQSVTKYVEDLIKTKQLTADEQDKLIELLKARFVGGEQSASKLNATVKDLGYMGTIANPFSAITQLADPAISASLYGLRNTLASMFGTKSLGIIDLGVARVATEITNADARTTARLLDKAMGLSLFKWTDKLGKETLINAAFRQAKGQVRTAKGEAAFRKKHGGVYGNEIDSLVSDLKAGDITENVKLFTFNALADVQPIALSEMPPMYLNNPNGRILYMLKSFTLKQYDIVRRNILQEWSKGNKVTAAKNAALLGGYLTVANTGTGVMKDILKGRVVDPEELPDRAMWALLGVFGFGKYATEKYLSRGDATGFISNMITPAAPIIDAAFSGALELTEEDPDFEKLVKPVPVVGEVVYSHLLGGAEEYNRDKLLGRK